MLIQAGQSGRGQAFAARWAELVFVIHHNLEAGRQQYAAFKDAVAAAGRDPAQVSVAPACYVIVAELDDAAQAKRAVIEASARPVDALVLISEVLNYDFGAKGYDEPFSDEELAGFSWHGFRERVVTHSGKKNPTVRDFVEVSGRGTIAEHKVFCGTPKSVADQMEEWFTAPACDGFVLAATHMPGAYEDVVRLLVPELQRRGLFQKEYRGVHVARKPWAADPARGGLVRRAEGGAMRSLLFTPGNHARRVEKALTLPADGVILDLEDAVAFSEKIGTRATVTAALALPRAGKLYVRVNGLTSDWCYGDIDAVVGKGLDGIILPKVEHAHELHTADWLIGNLERERGLPSGAVGFDPDHRNCAWNQQPACDLPFRHADKMPGVRGGRLHARHGHGVDPVGGGTAAAPRRLRAGIAGCRHGPAAGHGVGRSARH